MSEVIGVVGRDPNETVNGKRSVHRGQELSGDQATRSMAPFRPGVREHQMKSSHGSRRYQTLDGVQNLKSQNACIRQARPLDFSAGCPDPTQKAFDSKKIPRRILGRDGREKRAIAATKIDFERSAAAIDRVQVQRPKTIARDELGSACYVYWRIGGEHVR